MYEKVRQRYRPNRIKLLLIAESPPPPPEVESSRQFYYTDRLRRDDRLYINTIRAFYPKAVSMSATELEQTKEEWLHRLQTDGVYMIEALVESQPHEVTKAQRRAKLEVALPDLIRRVDELAQNDTKIILIKSNVFDVAAQPLRQAGFVVLNDQMLDYPGRFNQRDYREKLAHMIRESGVL